MCIYQYGVRMALSPPAICINTYMCIVYMCVFYVRLRRCKVYAWLITPSFCFIVINLLLLNRLQWEQAENTTFLFSRQIYEKAKAKIKLVCHSSRHIKLHVMLRPREINLCTKFICLFRVSPLLFRRYNLFIRNCSSLIIYSFCNVQCWPRCNTISKSMLYCMQQQMFSRNEKKKKMAGNSYLWHLNHDVFKRVSSLIDVKQT